MEKEAVKKIVALIRQQTEITRDLESISLKIRAAVETGNIKEVDILIKVQTALVMKFSADEKRITNQFALLRNSVGSVNDGFSIKDLRGHIDDRSMDEIENAGSELRGSFESLENINYTNMLLLKSKLDWIDKSMDFLKQKEVRTYKTDGSMYLRNSDILNDLF